MEEEITVTAYWRCILILIKNFHAVNKKISVCKVNTVTKITKGLHDIDVEHITYKDLEKLQFSFEPPLLSVSETDLTLLMQNYAQSRIDFDGFVISYDLLAKKQGINNKKAFGIIDFRRHKYYCKFLDSDVYDDFSVFFFENHLKIEMLTKNPFVQLSSRWCEFVLKPKLLNWCKSANQINGKETIQSLQLIDVAEYNDLYKELKQKYSEKALQFWTEAKESTDPLKFIYEDLAIAAYLICLWRSTRTSPIAFADLGCGNGLLVYILNEEGFHGYGFDIRARKLWSYYPEKICLIEQAIEPETFKLPKEVNWLIGNHSDELSPWLPVLAAVASHEMCYFLLPCCAYEFSGLKFQRRNSRLSGYADFLEYMQHVSNSCGYITLKDRLKIPSTKRIALVGIERLNAKAEYEIQNKRVWSFVGSERSLHGSSECIKLREKHEAVRNCTQIDKTVIDKLVIKIFALLLQQGSLSTYNANNPGAWNAGIHLSMRNIIDHFSKQDLSDIKNECGGIKTLLRNKHEIFEFFGNDLIGIRKPIVRVTAANKPQTVKKRLCFFKTNHPNGCPLSDNECSFIHADNI